MKQVLLTCVLIVSMEVKRTLGKALTEEADPKVLILGAGMSGITAAKTLEEAGVNNFLVLEGSSRIGGRMKSGSISGETVELGAMYTYGAGTNPIYNLYKQNGISVVEDLPGNVVVRDTSGRRVQSASTVESKMAKAVDGLDEDEKEARNGNLPDFTMSASLLSNGWNAKTALDDAIETYYVDFEYGAPPAAISGKYAYFNNNFEEYGSYDLPIVTDPRGCETLPEILASGFMDRILFDKVVTHINQTKDGVDVGTSDGTIYHSDYVIVTFSLGVLKNRVVSFSPDLPECKQFAIDSFGYCPFAHMYFKFPSTFWDDRQYILFASEQRSKHAAFLNMNYVRSGSNTLQLSVWWEESRRMERLSDEEIVAEVVDTLRTMYPKSDVPFPEGHAISSWTYDPLFHGAWSFWTPGFNLDHFEDMRQTFGRIFFAGEHTDPLHHGFKHGAYNTGIKTSEAVLDCLQDPANCPEYDSFECSGTSQSESDSRFG